LLSKINDLKIYRVFLTTNAESHWKGFSNSDNSLEESLKFKVLFNENDIKLALNLLNAYQNNDIRSLQQLSKNQSGCFHHLSEIIDAYINIKPEVFIRKQIENGLRDFDSVFKKFQEELGFLVLEICRSRSFMRKF
jgi:hypothetical protein